MSQVHKTDCYARGLKIKGLIFIKLPTRYMIKKYGWRKAFDINLTKALKKYAKR